MYLIIIFFLLSLFFKRRFWQCGSNAKKGMLLTNKIRRWQSFLQPVHSLFTVTHGFKTKNSSLLYIPSFIWYRVLEVECHSHCLEESGAYFNFSNMSKNWIFLEIFSAIREGTDLWPHYSKLILSKKVDTFAKLPPAFRGKWDYMARRISVEMNFTYQAIASQFIVADYYNNFNFKALFNVVVSLLPKEWFLFRLP